MHRKYLLAALAAAIALIVAVPTTSGGQEQVADECTATLKDGTTAVKRAWSERHWRQRNPVEKHHSRTLRAVRQCVSTKERKELQRYTKKKKAWFGLYREYRLVATIPCARGAFREKDIWWAKSCYIIACESGYSWSAANGSSSARGPYQMLDTWNRPWPVRSLRDKLTHHVSASKLGDSHWVCA